MKKLIHWILVLVLAALCLMVDKTSSKAQENVLVIGTQHSIELIEWSPQGDVIASTYWNVGITESSQITLWDVITGETIEIIQPFGKSRVEAFAWSPDGSRLASRLGNYTIALWDFQQKEVAASVELDDFLPRDVAERLFGGLNFSPDGAYVAGIEDEFVNIWNVSEGSVFNINFLDQLDKAYELADLPHWITWGGDAEWSPDSNRLAMSERGGELLLLSNDGDTLGASPSPLGYDDQPGGWSQAHAHHFLQHLSWRPDGSQIASFYTNSFTEIFSIYIWDGHTAELVSNIDYGGPYEINAIAWNPVRDVIAIACSDNRIRILDANTFEILDTLEAHTDKVTTIAWNPDGTRLASGSLDKTIRIWDIE